MRAYLFTFILPLKWFELHIFYINKCILNLMCLNTAYS